MPEQLTSVQQDTAKAAAGCAEAVVELVPAVEQGVELVSSESNPGFESGVDREDEAGSREGDPGDGGQRLVPVTEAIRYRKRAQAAEQQLQEMRGQVKEMTGRLVEAQRAIDGLERRRQIDAFLADEEAMDLEVARLLTEVAVEMMEEPDIKLAVDDLKRQKPYLFRRRQAEAASMPANVRSGSQQTASHMAATAASSGDRRDLLRYLRLRRGA